MAVAEITVHVADLEEVRNLLGQLTLERDAAQAEAAELRARIATLSTLPVIAYKGPHDTDASMLLHAADRIQRSQPFGSNLTAAVVRVIRDAVIRSQS